MDAELWSQAGDIIVAALELQGSDREHYLEQQTTGRPELLAEVRKHLESYEKAGSAFLDKPLFDVQNIDQTSGLIGRQIGPYTLTKLIGQGGMGTVYLAERADGTFDREVAVKLVSTGQHREDLERSLEYERQILARLDHPNIAKLLDAGTTDEGWPYFVMEYIAGEPIDRFCRRRRLSVDERLKVIRSVCSAVQYAHQNLVIHRDLKPGNILVDEDGVPHLLDFGIAKILRPGPLPTITARGRRPMTLEYASPEQLLYQPITVASDVYSLGLVFYELLIGRRAYSFDGVSPGEIERLICEHELPPPSVAITIADEPVNGEVNTDPEEFGERDPKRLARRLNGDLDNIVHMALRKEPLRRFGSVAQFADDLRRTLTGLPVTAQKDTFPYRAGKFLRRNRLAVATSLFVVLFMVGSIVSLLVQRREVTDQRDAAQHLSDELTLERDGAEQVIAFLTNLFITSHPTENKGPDTTVRELLDEGIKRLKELDTQPIVQAKMMSAIAHAYHGLGLYEEQRHLLTRTLEIRRSLLEEGHVDIAEALHNLAGAYEKQGHYDEAEKLFQEALAIFEAQLGPEDLVVLACRNYLASVYLEQERFEEAAEQFRQIREIRERTIGKDDRSYAGALNNLAAVYRRAGRYAEAEVLQKESLEVVTRVLGEKHPDTVTLNNTLGRIYRLQGLLKEAEPLLEEAFASRLKTLGADHPLVINSLLDLATLYRVQGRFEEAERLYLRALDTCEGTLNDDHPYVSQGQNGLAQVYVAQGRFDEARPVFKSALDIRTRTLGPRHSRVAEVLRGQADLHRGLGEHSEAEALYRQVLEIQHEKLGPEHPRVAATLEGYAALLKESGRVAEAEPLTQQAARIRNRVTTSANAG